MKLMIKRHQDTGLKYLHYTNRTDKDVDNYLGSGVYWKRHLKKHGTNVISCLVLESDNQKLMTNYAVYISEECDIVASDEWANLTPENCLQGSMAGMVTVRENGECFNVSKDDPRWVSGELISANSGTHNGRYGKTGGMYERTPEQNKARSIAATEYSRTHKHPMEGKKQPKITGSKNPGAKAIMYEGEFFGSIVEAESGLQRGNTYIRKRLRDPSNTNCYYL